MSHELIALIIGDSLLAAVSTALWFVCLACCQYVYIITHPQCLLTVEIKDEPWHQK